MINIFEIAKLEQCKIESSINGVRLFKTYMNTIDQENYIAVECMDMKWYTYNVQRGKRFLRYSSPIYEYALISACFLFQRNNMNFCEPYDWSTVDHLINDNHISEAIQKTQMDLLSLIPDKQNWQISLQESGTMIDVFFHGAGEDIRITTSTSYHQALRAYRNYFIKLVRFHSIYSDFLLHFTELDTEYIQFLDAFLT